MRRSLKRETFVSRKACGGPPTRRAQATNPRAGPQRFTTEHWGNFLDMFTLICALVTVSAVVLAQLAARTASTAKHRHRLVYGRRLAALSPTSRTPAVSALQDSLTPNCRARTFRPNPGWGTRDMI